MKVNREFIKLSLQAGLVGGLMTLLLSKLAYLIWFSFFTELVSALFGFVWCFLLCFISLLHVKGKSMFYAWVVGFLMGGTAGIVTGYTTAVTPLLIYGKNYFSSYATATDYLSLGAVIGAVAGLIMAPLLSRGIVHQGKGNETPPDQVH